MRIGFTGSHAERYCEAWTEKAHGSRKNAHRGYRRCRHITCGSLWSGSLQLLNDSEQKCFLLLEHFSESHVFGARNFHSKVGEILSRLSRNTSASSAVK